jgi:hypothetical protein
MVGPQLQRADPRLRSAQAVSGYHLRTGDKIIGHVCDFMMDASSWEIGQLVVKAGHRFSGNEILLPTKAVERISYEDSTVFAHLVAEAVAPSQPNPLASAVAAH